MRDVHISHAAQSDRCPPLLCAGRRYAAPVLVIVHGWQGSGPEHWQSRLAARLPEVRYPRLPDADRPRRAAWLAALADTLAGLPDGGFDVVCHSLAVPLWLHHAAAGSGPRAARVLLVAPPSPTLTVPELAGFLPPPLDPAAVARVAGHTELLGTDDDPYCPEGALAAYGRPLGVPTTVVPGGGHLNVEAGYGPWPAMEAWARSPGRRWAPTAAAPV